MQRDRLVFGLTAVFAGMTVVVALVGVAFREPVLFVVVVPLAAASYMFWYQSSGKLRERLRASARARREGRTEERGGFGAGPRGGGGFEGARGRRAREEWERRNRRRRGSEGPGAGIGPQSGMSRAEAYRRLGLEDGADEAAVKRAYRRKVKEVHPDSGGDETEFRKVTEAYETLTR